MICCYSTNTILFNFIKSRPFQYIICCYSTINKASLPRTFPNFNTFHAVIQHFMVFVIIVESNFNTFHVVIQRSFQTVVCFKINNFNTFHVVIQPRKCISFTLLISFQYITCCYSTQTTGHAAIHSFISIHPMLLFNSISSTFSVSSSSISIHPMLLFNQRKTVILVSY